MALVMPISNQVTNVATVVAKGTQSASTMAPETSAFDVWNHSYDGLSESMQDFANDPVGTLQNRAEQESRMREAMGPDNWESSNGQQARDSMASQWDSLGDQLNALGSSTVTNPDGTTRSKSALEYVGQGFQLLTGAEQMLSSLVSVIPFPAFPAVRITDIDVGLPHAHGHPPNLIPPAPPVPLPSTGPIIPIPLLSGAAQTLINGMPAARCGDMGLGVWCGGYFPMYEVFLGSSNVWIEGARAGRIACDITKHCMFTTPKPNDPPLGPMIGITCSSSGNVMIGGVPMPSLVSLGMGAAMKGLGALVGKGARAFGRATSGLRQALAKRLGIKPGFLKCTVLRAEPVNVVTGEVVIDQQDFSIPGRIPLEWNRHYGSSSKRKGVCGYGWESPADIRLELTDEGTVILHQGADGVAIFPYLPEQNSVMEFTDGAVLSRQKNYLVVQLKGGLNYYFPIQKTNVQELVIESISDQHGNYLYFEWDKDGLKQITESAGRCVEVISKNGLIQEMWLHHPDEKKPRKLIQYEYNPQTLDLITVFDALDSPYRFEYRNHCCIKHTDRNDLSFYYEYDVYSSLGHCLHTWGDGGLYDYHMAFNTLKGETKVTDSLGNVSLVEYNEIFQVIKEVDPLNGVTLYEYDDGGRTSAVVDKDGNRTEYLYDERGNLIQLVRPDENSILTEFDTDNKVRKITDPNGAEWRQDWDKQGLLSRQVSPLGAESCYQYDRYGQLVGFTNPMGAHSTLGFDTYGNLTQLTDALGHTTEFTYDILGNVISKTDPLTQRTTYEYDLKGRLSKATMPSGVDINCVYDHEDNLTQYVDENGAETRLEYFGQGEIKRRIQADGHSVEYHYNTEEQLIGVTNQRGELYQLIRDPLGRIIEEVDYWGQGRQYIYTGAGYLKESTDPLGRVIHYETDPLGRIVTKLLPDVSNPNSVQTESFEYDANGNLTACENTAIRIERSFDEEGHLLEESQGETCTMNNTYDLNGNRISRTTEVNIAERHYANTVNYKFDSMDQAIGVEIEGHDPLKFTRNALGQITEEVLSKSIHRNFGYSSDGYLNAQKVMSRGSPLFKQDYFYEPAGNLIEKRDSVMGSDHFTYDPLGRLVSHLNPESQLIEYLNDPAGDRLRTQIMEPSLDGSNSSEWRREGEHEGLNYRFDRAGNLIDRNGSNDYTHLIWDANQRLSESSTNDRTTCYQYDPLGRRLSKKTEGVAMYFFWDGDALLGDSLIEESKPEELALSRLREWVYYPETFEPFLMVQNQGELVSDIYLYHNDPNGCPIRLLSVTGEVVWAARYSAWGGIDKLLVERVDNPLRLQGQYLDDETSLQYNRYRYFSSGLGDFVSKDPLHLYAGENVYSFAKNVHVWVDPLGLSCSSALRSIDDQLNRGKSARVTVGSRAEAEEILRHRISGPNQPGAWKNTTNVDYDLRGSQWLPDNVDRGTRGRSGTYHWDDFNPTASAGDHAIEGAHMQMHDWDGNVIRVFY